MSTVFHKKQFDLFKDAIDNDNLAQAYLFTGPVGVGKLEFAREVAQWLQSGDGRAYSSEALREGGHPDIIEASAPLPIAEARDIRRGLVTSPYSGKYKIVIINKAETMEVAAANALLKSIEEPKGDTIFFLITEYAENLLETIRSRCWEVKFGLVPDDVLEKNIDTVKINDIKAHWSGRPALAVKLLDNEEYQKNVRAYKKDCEKFLSGSLGERFAISEKYAKIKDDDFDILEVLRVWIEHAREKGIEENDTLSKLLGIYQNSSVTNANFKFALNNLAISLKTQN